MHKLIYALVALGIVVLLGFIGLNIYDQYFVNTDLKICDRKAGAIEIERVDSFRRNRMRGTPNAGGEVLFQGIPKGLYAVFTEVDGTKWRKDLNVYGLYM